ncbi:TonB-dependent receptor plug domain-containing protein [Spirosoma agri]|uniref:TonB-dependent receptor n=1 Tax=Spirosoma agri TaxID=1987381 RepID=A0A6M0IEC3_9BACT|nr:TonB-dependent receptor [Spirosoma agri]NEU66636.1 TonB-dependent receptor [Spirosoma agri]
MMSKISTLLSAALAVSSLSALAQENPQPASSRPVQLDAVTVTANKTEQKLSQTGKVVTVLSDSVLQRYATQTVSELLSRQAGLQIVGSNGPLGTNPDIYLRGASSGNTLILLDGLPVYDPSGTSNTFDLNLLTVGECDRIEILRGAQSTSYGSDAVAGVINIFTKRGSNAAGNKPFGVNASLNYGTYKTFRGTVGVNGQTSRLSYNVQYTRLSSAGFSAATDRIGTQNFDNDGYKQNALVANLTLQLSSRLSWKLQGLTTGYTADIDNGAFADEKDYTYKNTFKRFATGFEYKHAHGRLMLNYGISDSRRTYKNDSTSVEANASERYSYQEYGGVTHFLEAYHNLKLGSWGEILTGVDYRFSNTDQSYLSISQYGPYQSPPIGADTARIGQLGIYATGILTPYRGLSVELGGRYSRNSLYGNVFTYSFNPSYLVSDRIKLFVNLSSGFRAPTLYQLFSPYGNKALRPEYSWSTEAGVQLFTRSRNAWVRAVYFDRQIKDVLFFESLNTAPYGRYINFDRQHDHGVELEAQAEVNKLTFTGNVLFLTGAVKTNTAGRDTTYNNLFRRPKTQLNLSVGYRVVPTLFVSATLRSIGDRTDRFFNNETFRTDNVTLAAYTTIDLYVEGKITPQLRLYADVRNLFDQTYYDIYGYNTRRRNATVGLRFTL